MASSLAGEFADSLLLSGLAAQPLETRCAALLRSYGDLFSTVIQGLQHQNAPAFSALDTERVAWAIAYNISPPSAVPPEAGIPPQRPSSYCDHFPPETPWLVIWSKLIRVKNEGDDGCTLLRELLQSVACEQRQSWQPADSVPIDREVASLAFEFVYKKNRAKVVGALWSNFGVRIGDPEAIADEAWSRVFCDYWSSDARRRFLGLSRISTLVSQIARFVAIDVVRESQKAQDRSPDERDHDFKRVIEDLRIEPGVEDKLAAKELRLRIDLCMQELTARQRIVADMVWLRELSAKETAEALGISEPAVSQHVSKARDKLRNCLEKHGFRVGDYRPGRMIQ
jgi:RNA polymerase sigma factor (sigma-70 family)